MTESVNGIATYNSLLRTKINNFLKLKLKEIENDELVPSYGALFSTIYKHGGKVQISTLYSSLLKQKTTITEMINRLVTLGYLTKERCAEDKRVTYIVVTEKSLAFQKDFEKISQELLDTVLNGFTEEEKNEFVRLMFKAINNFT